MTSGDLIAEKHTICPLYRTRSRGRGLQCPIIYHGCLPIIAIGRREPTFDAHSVQDLQALNDAELLWDIEEPPPEASVPLATLVAGLGPRNPNPAPTATDPECPRITNALATPLRGDTPGTEPEMIWNGPKSGTLWNGGRAGRVEEDEKLGHGEEGASAGRKEGASEVDSRDGDR